MRKKMNLLLFVGVVFTVTATFKVTSIGEVSHKEKSKTAIVKDITTQDYNIKNVQKYEGDLVYNIDYPIFEDANISNMVNSHIKNLAIDFKQGFDGVNSKNQKFMFKLSTEVGNLNQLLFLKFNIEKNSKEYPNPIKYTKTIIIDKESNKEILPQDFLIKNYKELFYQEAKKYFLNTYGITITKDTEGYNDIKPVDANYSKVFFKDNNMQVFIYDYKKQDEVYFNINKDKVLPYIQKRYLETTTQATTKTETTTQTTTKTETTTQATTKTEPTTQAITKVETTTQATTKAETTTQATTKAETTTVANERKIDKNKPMIALTFDDGPNGKNTNRILDILEKNNSVATFFVVSRRLDEDKEVIKRMSDMGCEIGNHSANHKNLTTLDSKQINSELWLVNKKINEITGHMPTVVRPPYGAINDKVKAVAPYPFIMWSVDTRDWESRNSQAIQKQVLGKVKDGDIILMHDLYSTTADACEVIVPALVKQGFQFVTVDELLKYKGIDMQGGVKYFNGRK